MASVGIPDKDRQKPDRGPPLRLYTLHGKGKTATGRLPPSLAGCLSGGTALGPLRTHGCPGSGLFCLGRPFAHRHGNAGVGALAPGCSETASDLGFVRPAVPQGLSKRLVVFG